MYTDCSNGKINYIADIYTDISLPNSNVYDLYVSTYFQYSTITTTTTTTTPTTTPPLLPPSSLLPPPLPLQSSSSPLASRRWFNVCDRQRMRHGL